MTPLSSARDRPQLVLLDGHSLIYRAFFALPALSTARGELTNAVYGFTAMLLLVLADHPDNIAVCLDRAAPTFRAKESDAYKAHRKPMPDDLRSQMTRVRDVIDVFRIPVYELDGFEADDLIGTLAVQGEAGGFRTRIVTGDLDALQLVTDHVEVFTTKRGITDSVIYRPEQVVERYGLEPFQIPHLKALTGDTSDNIPGVPGVGEKTAAKLLQAHRDAEGVIAAIPDMAPGKVTTALGENIDQIRLSLRLATIDSAAPVQLDHESTRWRGYDFSAVKRLFDDLEFRALLPRLPEQTPEVGAAAASEPATAGQATFAFGAAVPAAAEVEVGSADGVARLIAGAGSDALVGIHVLTDGSARRGRMVGLGIAVPSGDGSRALYLPTPDERSERGAIAALESVSASRPPRLVAHDAKNVYLALTERGAGISGFAFDTYIAAHLTGQGRREPAIELLARDHLGLEMPSWEEVFGRGRTAVSPVDALVETAAGFAGRRAEAALRLEAVLRPAIETQGLTQLYEEVELPLVRVLGDVELLGVALDFGLLGEISTEVQAQQAILEAAIYEVAGYSFNINSTQKLAKFLYEELGLPTNRRNKTGYSTDAPTLEALRDLHPVIEQVLEHRLLSKLRSTYLDAFPVLVDGATGRIHTSYNQTTASTGRLSSSNPNLQNIPIRTETGRRIRRAFVAGGENTLLLSADYSQIELRVLAHMCQDPTLLEAFSRGEDIHQATAAAVFKVPLESVTKDQRRAAKVVNFGLLYGMGDWRLARDMGLTAEEARTFIDRYFGTFASVKAFLEGIRDEAHQKGFVHTLFGRRRLIPDIHSPNRQLRAAAERMAINMPIQGTAADIMKMAMVRLHDALPAAGLSGRMILSVHDELVLELPAAELAETRRLVAASMSEVASLAVPLEVEVNAGPNWGEITPVEDIEEAQLGAALGEA